MAHNNDITYIHRTVSFSNLNLADGKIKRKVEKGKMSLPEKFFSHYTLRVEHPLECDKSFNYKVSPAFCCASDSSEFSEERAQRIATNRASCTRKPTSVIVTSEQPLSVSQIHEQAVAKLKAETATPPWFEFQK